MTIEDFFTLTEMKDGLTSPARVKELVNVMQKEKDCIVKNVGDTTRQWSTVASTIAATEDKDCLDLFVQLDGLCFIDRWLKDAQRFGNDTNDRFVEESITALLRALEKLQIDYQKSISQGIWMTVENLLDHSSSRVQDRAKALFNSWKQDGDVEAVPQFVEKAGASHTDVTKGSGGIAGEGGPTELSARDITLSVGDPSEEKHVDLARDKLENPVCADVSHPENVDYLQIQASNRENTSDHQVMKGESSSYPIDSSVVLKPMEENFSIEEQSPIVHAQGVEPNTTNSSVVLKQSTEGKSDVPVLNEYSDKGNQMQVVISPLSKSMEISSASNLVEPKSPLDNNAGDAQESVTELELQKNLDAKDKGCPRDSATGDVKMDVLEGKSRMDDTGSSDCSKSMVVVQNQGLTCANTSPLDSSGNEGKLQKMDDADTSFSSEDSETADRVKEHASDESEDLGNDSNFLRAAVETKDPDVVDKRRPDLELDYSMVDALEVARQVAIEVEQEVVDRREPSCSSSERISQGGIRQTGSPRSINGKEIQSVEVTSKEVPTGPSPSTETSLKEEGLLNSAKDLGSEAENCVQDMEGNTEKGLGDFDLNKKFCSEEIDYPVSPMSTPVSVVSASRAAAVPGLPAAPLQFEGAHGWKGSAATSAFRPASPRKILEGDKTLTIRESHNSSKQRPDCLDIDLNVAEAGDEKIADLITGKKGLVSSGLPFGDSLVEGRSERLKLDLNRMSDDGDAPSDWRMEGRPFHHRNGHHSPSASSSSSSMQPALRNIDLNDQPSFHIENTDLQFYSGKSSSQNLNASGSIDSVISIMGTRVEVKRKDFAPQTTSMPNGRILEPALDVNLARSSGGLGMGSAVPYAHPPIFAYNGLATGPPVSFSTTMYGPGPVPYMMDSRVAPVVPQVMASSSASPAAYPQPPFFMSMIGAPPGSSGAGPSRPNFDLNSGLMIDGSRESGGLRQLLNPGQSRPIDEHLRVNAQPALDSGGAGKRKEPDGGWEPYPFNFRHHQPPWK
ncbi:uncharacterized protein LOC127807947 [Diospyros lotus]|uniref:uncharacterized protein LOC127807947 n=1 Tax=Diospyros lotus TaxID=55363 RepID=UPI002254BC45|nr:uncharacterized protein LOC127807947 [Diospyros lotus]XP_052202151.1 uncharacterized protein LOC127807947 [Diospyros lotus]XP_052202152.1 uncharacterized protein LOC127807947 [Diospyros lotus]